MTGWRNVSAVVLAAYFIFLIGYVVAHPGIGYAQWHGLFANNWMRIFSLLALVALGAHAWVGMWTIATDYLTPMALGKSATAYVSFSRQYAALRCSLTSSGVCRFSGVSESWLTFQRFLSTPSLLVVAVLACALRCNWHKAVTRLP
jgi:succinate dehydrogenase hydrophobic membrane anchor protein